MASIFTFDPDPPRVSSPWSTPGASTPQLAEKDGISRHWPAQNTSHVGFSPTLLQDVGLSKLEPEPQEGCTEYKLHLLLRPRRKFSSTSTASLVSGSQHSKVALSTSDAPVDDELALLRPSFTPSTQTRQARLQQLTTQLLWRLQQSSPFHSSSAGSLVLPLLPEATPTLGVPTRPAKVLPGLEESQGALYEIGVADDGTFVGLIEEELEESIMNLKAMAASLGCVVELQRKVVVGNCEWIESRTKDHTEKAHAEKLWVAEVLVRPDMNSSDQEVSSSSLHLAPNLLRVGSTAFKQYDRRTSAQQVRVALTGCSASGKSSLLGTLTTSALDNGRGKSRLSLLKHRHELASGITSSVAQELIGYRSLSETNTVSLVMNYSSQDVSSWSDIHHLSDRLVFLSDSPGLPRYAKSAFRTLVSWDPHWTIVCLAAEDDRPSQSSSNGGASQSGRLETELDTTLSHLTLCLKLGLPIIVTITKLDLATKPGLRQTLTKALSCLKTAGRTPVVLNTTLAPALTTVNETGESIADLNYINLADEQEVQRLMESNQSPLNVVPIVLTSAVTGAGIGKLHALLKSLIYQRGLVDVPSSLHMTERPETADNATTSKVFQVDEVFSIPPSKVYVSSTEISKKNQGIVLCGYVNQGNILMGDELILGPFLSESAVELGRQGSSLRRSSSFSTSRKRPGPGTSLSSDFARNLHLDSPSPITSPNTGPVASIRVRVVSLRNLRLSVRCLLHGQVGTIGIVPTDPGVTVLRARKGMVLLDPKTNLTGYRTFTSSFPASEFASTTSPPLILGGHAIIFVNSIRAAVKVTAVALAENDRNSASSSPSSPSPQDVFDFESEDDGISHPHRKSNPSPQTQQPNPVPTDDHDRDHDHNHDEIKITFRFVSSVEWMRAGDQVFVVPTASAAGPIAGPAVPSHGLNGFVGRVCDFAF